MALSQTLGSARSSRQIVQLCPNLVLCQHTRPGRSDTSVRCDQDGDRLIRHAVFRKDVLVLVQTPQDVARDEQFIGPRLGLCEVGFPCRGNEVHPVAIVGSYGIDDGQLPPTGGSPFGPEDQVNGPLRIGQPVLATVAELQSEVRRDR